MDKNSTRISAKEAARELGYAPEYVASLCRSGKLVAERGADGWSIEQESLEKYKRDIEEQKAIRAKTLSREWRKENREARQAAEVTQSLPQSVEAPVVEVVDVVPVRPTKSFLSPLVVGVSVVVLFVVGALFATWQELTPVSVADETQSASLLTSVGDFLRNIFGVQNSAPLFISANIPTTAVVEIVTRTVPTNTTIVSREVSSVTQQGVTFDVLTAILGEMHDSLVSDITRIAGRSVGDSVNLIDRGLSLSDLTDANIPDDLTLSLSNPLGVSSGGTGVSTAPSYGQVLLGNSSGGYDLVATSSLGITGSGGSGGADFAWTLTTFGGTAANSTSTLIGFTNGIYALASSTIGAGGQTTGLTISGGATTTGSAYVGGRVGIGTAGPAAYLDVLSSDPANIDAIYWRTATQISGILSSSAGTAAGVLILKDGNNTNVVRIDGKTGNSSYINNGGNLGIGTTSPYAKLSVAGDIVANNVWATSTTATNYFAGNVTIASTTASRLASLQISTTTTGQLFLVNSNTPSSSGGAFATLLLSQIPIAADQRLGGITFGYNNGGNSTTNRNASAITAYTSEAWTAGSAQGSTLRFETTGIGSASRLERMRIDSTGNVGIGTTSPLTKLSVAGSAYIGGNLTATGTLAVAGNTSLTGSLSVSGASTLANATTTALAITTLTSTLLKTDSSGNVIPAVAGTDYVASSSFFSYPFSSNATSTTLSFTGGLTSYASTTIGDGTQIGGLTVSGGATTTGNAYFAGSVGVGTAGPNAKLEVNGTFRAGNTTDRYMTYDSSADNITLRTGSFNLSFGFDDANSFRPTIGITGTTNQLITPALYAKSTAAASLTNTLSLENTNSTAGTSATGINFRAGGNVGKGLIAFTNQSIWGVGDLIFGINNSANNTVVGLSDARMVIQGSTGNVGLGTTSPYAKLSVVGPVVAEYFHATSTTATSTFAGGFSAASSLYVLQNGNVGIGTASPLAALQVFGATSKEIQIGSTAGIYSNSSYFTDLSTLGSVINLSRPSGGAFVHSIFSYDTAGGTLNNLGLASRHNIHFVTGANAGPMMTLSSDRNVGIGTTTPDEKLTVADGIKIFDAGSPYDTLIALYDSADDGIIDVYANTIVTTRLHGNGDSYFNGGSVGIGTTTPWGKLSVTNTGSGPSFIVEDGTSPDSTPFIVDASGNVGIGTASPNNYAGYGTLTINGTSGGEIDFQAGGTTAASLWSEDSDLVLNATNDVYVTGSNFGISTSSPATNFAVSGSGYFTGGLGVGMVNTAAGTFKLLNTGFIEFASDAGRNIEIKGENPYYDFSSGQSVDYDWRIQQTSASNLYSISASSTANILNLLGNGNVGIGTTSPVATLAISGRTDNNGLAVLDPSMSATESNYFKLGRNQSTKNQADIFFNYAGDASNSNSLRFGFYGTGAYLTVLAGGNVGIGTTTPTAKLEINGTNAAAATSGSAENGALRVASGSNTAMTLDLGVIGGSGAHAWLQARNKLDYSSNQVLALNPNGGNVGIGTTSPSARLSVDTTSLSAGVPAFLIGSTTKTDFIITQNGSVGFGTTSPATSQGKALHFSNTLSDGGSINENTVIIVESANRNAHVLSRIPSNKQSNFLSIAQDDSTIYGGMVAFGGSGSPYLQLWSNNAARATIDSSGNFGIGTTTPSAKFSVTQSAQTAAGGIWLATSNNTDFRSQYMDTSGVLSFYGGDTAGTLNIATLNAAGEWTNASDQAYKDDVQDISYGLDTLIQLRPRSYVIKHTNDTRVGFIAQEVESVVPEVVSGTEGSKGISYGNLVAVVVKAVQELYVLVLSMQDTLTSFGQRVDTKELCLGSTCITESDLQEFVAMKNSKIATASQVNGTTTLEIYVDDGDPVVVDIVSSSTTTIDTGEGETSTTEPEPSIYSDDSEDVESSTTTPIESEPVEEEVSAEDVDPEPAVAQEPEPAPEPETPSVETPPSAE